MCSIDSACLTIRTGKQNEVKLYGDMKRYAPNDGNEFVLTLDQGASLGDLLEMLAITTDRQVSRINGRRASREARLNEDDTVVLFSPVSGG
jgi:molybdopterin converting factor small subunit